MNKEDMEFARGMILHNMAMSNEEEIACLGRLAKIIVPQISDFIDSERQRETELAAVLYAIVKSASLTVGLFLPRSKPGHAGDVANLAIEMIKDDLTRMGKIMDDINVKMASGGQ